jgi:O-Antigen ligase
MAKRQIVEPANSRNELGRLDPLCFALALLAGAIIYVMYHPSDSVAVERGDALWFCMLALIIGSITWATSAWRNGASLRPRRSTVHSPADWLLDVVPWLLAIWIWIAAFSSSPPGNLRLATNEAWLWLAGAAVFTSARRLFDRESARKSMIVLLVVGTTGLAIHGLHQYFIGLPQQRAEYKADPERIIREAGLDAPAGSAERMVFENRLFDGGPTATFALANSFAAVLLVGILLSAGVLRMHWQQFLWRERLLWAIPILISGSALLGTRSRSALLAALIGLGLIFVVLSRSGDGSEVRFKRSRVLLFGLGGVSLIGILIAVFVAAFGNREWFEEAPASLSVRFQYWRSTWQMVLERPWFGSGPGNYQAIYERYREADTTEQIAEPHNLFFETLASGGFVGLTLLLILGVACFWQVARRQDPESAATYDTVNTDKWVWLGAMLSLLLVWVMGWASRRVPDVEASLFALPVSIGLACGLGLMPQRRQAELPTSSSQSLDPIIIITLVALILHLMVSGGWTVPGVVIMVWLGAGILTRRSRWLSQDEAEVAGSRLRRNLPSAAVVCLGVGSAVLLKQVSITPVEEQTRAMEMMAFAQSQGQLGKARTSLMQAVEADSWSPDAMLWLADYHRWRMIMEGDSPSAREQWAASLLAAKQRGGEDPALYRMVGAQQLHLYQRYGNPADLAAAASTFREAAAWSPSNQWMIAQLSVILAAQGDTQNAQLLSERARELADLGGNIERALIRQQLYVPTALGIEATRGPVRRPASEMLRSADGN